MSKLLPEFACVLKQEFSAVTPRLFESEKDASKCPKGVVRTSFSIKWNGRQFRLFLQFIGSERFYLWVAMGEAEKELRFVDALRRFEDDYYLPGPPTPTRFVSGLLKTAPGRKHLDYVLFDDSVLDETIKNKGIPKEALDLAADYLRSSPNPWSEFRKFDAITPEDAVAAVGGKIGALLNVLREKGADEVIATLEAKQ